MSPAIINISKHSLVFNQQYLFRIWSLRQAESENHATAFVRFIVHYEIWTEFNRHSTSCKCMIRHVTLKETVCLENYFNYSHKSGEFLISGTHQQVYRNKVCNTECHLAIGILNPLFWPPEYCSFATFLDFWELLKSFLMPQVTTKYIFMYSDGKTHSKINHIHDRREHYSMRDFLEALIVILITVW